VGEPLGQLRVVEVSDRIAGGLLRQAGSPTPALTFSRSSRPPGSPLRGLYRHRCYNPPPAGTRRCFCYLNAGKRRRDKHFLMRALAGADVVVRHGEHAPGALRRGPRPSPPARRRATVRRRHDLRFSAGPVRGPSAPQPSSRLQAWSGCTGFSAATPDGPPIAIGGEFGGVHGRRSWLPSRCWPSDGRVRRGGPRRAPRHVDARGADP